MAQIDRATARALAEAGYMPLREYLAMFGDEVTTEAARKLRAADNDPTPTRSARPVYHDKRRPIHKRRRLAS
jgi:hypothetical protein